MIFPFQLASRDCGAWPGAGPGSRGRGLRPGSGHAEDLRCNTFPEHLASHHSVTQQSSFSMEQNSDLHVVGVGSSSSSPVSRFGLRETLQSPNLLDSVVFRPYCQLEQESNRTPSARSNVSSLRLVVYKGLPSKSCHYGWATAEQESIGYSARLQLCIARPRQVLGRWETMSHRTRAASMEGKCPSSLFGLLAWGPKPRRQAAGKAIRRSLGAAG